ncbi:MAG: SOS response-associated peptidase [Flavobacteriia bacterium]|nr:SOS response-associated peptidase [Flavobacteriia bacterium]
MCFFTKQSKEAVELERRFNAQFIQKEKHQPKSILNGFEHPKTPIICSYNPTEIQLGEWGLIPSWAKESSFQKNTLNAQVETLKEKASFKEVYRQRCLVIADGFYEWQWLDEKGRKKQKYLIKSKEAEIFSFAGLWSIWLNPLNQEKKLTYTIITTKANELMEKIHNHKKRMPVILEKSNEIKWIKNLPLQSNSVELMAEEVD